MSITWKRHNLPAHIANIPHEGVKNDELLSIWKQNRQLKVTRLNRHDSAWGLQGTMLLGRRRRYLSRGCVAKLQGRVDAAEGCVAKLPGRLDAAEGCVAKLPSSGRCCRRIPSPSCQGRGRCCRRIPSPSCQGRVDAAEGCVAKLPRRGRCCRRIPSPSCQGCVAKLSVRQATNQKPKVAKLPDRGRCVAKLPGDASLSCRFADADRLLMGRELRRELRCGSPTDLTRAETVERAGETGSVSTLMTNE
ncbi:hypothetical protein R1sor_026520 [Riccia sorocarpa]|uniref:Uncharacterized protein n=1 Tax=Riccia sorocarpa TaxID=122646 RepID=A0ABD3GDB5_9MARC